MGFGGRMFLLAGVIMDFVIKASRERIETSGK